MARHVEQQAGDRLGVLGVARELVQTLDRRLVRHAARQEHVGIRIDSRVRIAVGRVLPRQADQVLFVAATQGERLRSSPPRTTVGRAAETASRTAAGRAARSS